MTDSIGPKKTISITLIIWLSISIAAYFVTSVTAFYVVAMGAGAAIGSSQSASRSLMALLTPKEQEAEISAFMTDFVEKLRQLWAHLFTVYWPTSRTSDLPFFSSAYSSL